MSNQINPAKKSLTIKDLVTTGIFSAIFLVFTMIGGIFFAPNPVLTFYMPMGAALLCGPVYLLMIAKVQKRWSVTILGIVMGIIWFVTGMHWAFSLGQHRTIHKRHFSEQQQPRKARITLLIDSREHTASSRQAGPVSQKQIC